MLVLLTMSIQLPPYRPIKRRSGLAVMFAAFHALLLRELQAYLLIVSFMKMAWNNSCATSSNAGRLVSAMSNNQVFSKATATETVVVTSLGSYVAIQTTRFYQVVNSKIRIFSEWLGGKDNADKEQILVMHQNGETSVVNTAYHIRQGDEIMVLPKVKTRRVEIARGIAQVIYQLAVATGVIVRL